MEVIIIKSLVFIIWQAYAILEGIREGYYFHFKNTNKDVKVYELHPLFSVQRALFCIAVLVCTQDIWLAVSLPFLFSFWHDGAYYIQRNKLDPHIYPLKFTDYSTTSTAKIELNFEKRVWLFVIGLLLFGVSIALPYFK